MGTPEFSILRSTWIDSVDLVDDLSIGSWVHRMNAVLLDIQSGLITKSRAADKSHLRLKITSILLSKVLSNDDSVVAQLPCFKEQFEIHHAFIPTMDWGHFFHCISVLGLGTELPELLVEMELEVQEIIIHELTKWVEFITGEVQGQLMEQYSCHFAYSAMVINFYIAMLLLQNSFKNFEFMYNVMKNVFSFVLQCPRPRFVQLLLSDVSDTRSLSIMVRKLQVADFRKPHAASHIELPDLICNSQITHLLTATSIQNIKRKGTEENSKRLLKVLSGFNHYFSSRTEENLRPTEHNMIIPTECNELAKKLIILLHDQFTQHKMQKNAKICAELMDTVESLEQASRSEGAVQKNEEILSYETMLRTITHFLPEYDNAVQSLLTQMVEDPFKNQNWSEAFICLERCPESLAAKSHLMLILRGISACEAKENRAVLDAGHSIAIALKFQVLFWAGFRLLRLCDKMQVCETVLSNEELAKLLAEYPMTYREKDNQKVHGFEQNQSKKINLFFDSLIKVKAVDDSMAESFSEICLSSPEVTIQKLVVQATRNKQQSALVIDLFVRFHHLLSTRIQSSPMSFFWDSFKALMKSLWKRSDDAAVNNGFEFLNGLLEETALLQSGPFQHLVEEVFNGISSSLNEESRGEVGDEESGQFPEKLATKLFSCLIDVPEFLSAVALEQITILCISLGGKIESSFNLWISDSKFDEESYAIKLTALKVLVNETAKGLQGLKDTDANLFAVLLNWIVKVVGSFTWMTQLRFLPLLKLDENMKIRVPSCLLEVCDLPHIFEPSEELSYGPGTGLLPWHQCFVVDPTLCPLASLNIESLATEELTLFSSGWIITLSQVLPFVLAGDWCLLLEAAKVLIGDFRLRVPFSAKHMITLPTVDICETYSILSVVQLLSQVFDVMSQSAYSSLTWLHLSKCYARAINSHIGDSPEFDRASLDAQAFMLAQIFCSACDVNTIFSNLQHEQKHSNCTENIFVLLLDIVRSFEKIIEKVIAEHEIARKGSISDTAGSDESPISELQIQGSCRKSVFELSNRLCEMMTVASRVKSGENVKTLTQKLSHLMDALKL